MIMTGFWIYWDIAIMLSTLFYFFFNGELFIQVGERYIYVQGDKIIIVKGHYQNED